MQKSRLHLVGVKSAKLQTSLWTIGAKVSKDIEVVIWFVLSDMEIHNLILKNLVVSIHFLAFGILYKGPHSIDHTAIWQLPFGYVCKFNDFSFVY